MILGPNGLSIDTISWESQMFSQAYGIEPI